MILPAMRVETSGIWRPRMRVGTTGAAPDGGAASGVGASAGDGAAPGAGRLIAVISAVSVYHTRARYTEKGASLTGHCGHYHAVFTGALRPWDERARRGALSRLRSLARPPE